MKITYFETYINGVQYLGTDFTSIFHDLNTQVKINNAIKKHVKKLDSLKNIHPCLNGNYQVKYHSINR